MAAYEIDNYDELIAGMVEPIVTQSIIINVLAGAVYTRGMVMARISFTADGTWVCKAVDSAAAGAPDKVPVGILADENVDATVAIQRATIYTQGEFNRAALKFGGTDTITTHEAALNAAKLYTKRAVG
ncbi:head decoration protein [Paenibacillus psychroresistens]|uniref:Head decoration protein n=1 Tax=Paenibacillus psychroresistens TaxID=1778678 RepID=A0A6B8RMK1_9BACL|nr:head decoration protein [Paenibacillus psychroresistens]QGQ97067.1 head decoration protein [Paenibacillus psychroresistens]